MKKGFTQHHFTNKPNTTTPKENGAGFTILELLVVVAIIGLLASAAMALLDNAKVKSRDSRRMSDLGEIRNGLNLYFTDNNLFPAYPGGITITGTDAFSNTLTAGEYMTLVPSDPISPIHDYVYTSNNSGTDWTITFCLEGDSIPTYSTGCGNEITP